MKLGLAGAIAVVFIVFITSCQSEENIEFKRYYSSGALVYQMHCQNCHGISGQGLSALIPPIDDSVYLKNNKASLACMVRYGLKGQIMVKGRAFEGVMPANDLSPVEIAQVLTYFGNSFGNKLQTINTQEVQIDLSKCK